MTVAMALAEMTHHTATRGPKMARAGEEGHEEYDAPRRHKHPELFKLFEEEPGGVRPEAFAEPRPQERIQRHTMEQLADFATMVQLLDVLVPLMVDQLVAVLKPVDSSVPDQKTQCPRSRCHPALCARPLPPRRWWNSWLKCLRTWWS